MSLQEKMLAVMDDMNEQVVEREELIEAIAIALLTRKNLFILGAPGQAKSFAINQFRARITGARQFERLLTKQTDEDQLFGRVDLASLIPGGVSQAVLEQDLYYRELQAHLTGAMEQFRQQDGDRSAAEALQAAQEQLSSYTKALGQLHAGTPCVNTTDKIPEADIIMLDEIFKCNDGVLNSLLTALNERKYTLPPELSYFIDQLAEEIVLSETIPTCRLCSIGECQSQVGGLVCRNAVKAWLLERAKRYLCPKAEAKTGDKRE